MAIGEEGLRRRPIRLLRDRERVLLSVGCMFFRISNEITVIKFNEEHRTVERLFLIRTPPPFHFLFPPNLLNLTLCQNAHFPSPLISLLPISSPAWVPSRVCLDAVYYSVHFAAVVFGFFTFSRCSLLFI